MTAASQSSGHPMRPPSSGCFVRMNAWIELSSAARRAMGVSTSAGAITFTRIFCGA